MSDAKASLEASQELNQKLDLIAERVRLKFHSFGDAFCFFDVSYKNRVHFHEFSHALDQI